jgi:hypothetical protein
VAQFLRWRLQELTTSKSKDPVKNWYCEKPPQRTAQVSSHSVHARSLDITVASRQLLAAARRLRKVQRGIPARDFTDGGKALLRLLQDEGHEATKQACPPEVTHLSSLRGCKRSSGSSSPCSCAFCLTVFALTAALSVDDPTRDLLNSQHLTNRRAVCPGGLLLQVLQDWY